MAFGRLFGWLPRGGIDLGAFHWHFNGEGVAFPTEERPFPGGAMAFRTAFGRFPNGGAALAAFGRVLRGFRAIFRCGITAVVFGFAGVETGEEALGKGAAPLAAGVEVVGLILAA